MAKWENGEMGKEQTKSFLRFYHFAILLFALCLFPTAGICDGWKQAEGPRKWSFPADHGAHPGYKTEWWYFTGNLADEKGNRFGYQLTFFRRGIRMNPTDPHNPWSIGDLYLAHFTVTDIARKRFVYDERVSRTGPGLAGAKTDRLDIWLLDWSAKQTRETIVLRARSGTMEIVLELAPRKPVVLHGQQGLSGKGSRKGQASYYASWTNLATTGRLKTADTEGPVSVKGVSWFDHEFGSNQLTPEQAGWDWFSLHLSDGTDIMLYLIRRTDGSIEPESSGTIIDPEGKARHVTSSEVKLAVLDHWKSPNSGAVYPSRWRIEVPSEGLDLLVSPSLPDQELRTATSTGVTYWEGAVVGQGQSKNRTVTFQGYAELTGYAGSLGGLF